MGTGHALTLSRRHLLGAGAAFALSGCRDGPPHAVEGGFVGPSVERGHRLRQQAVDTPRGRPRKVHTLIAGGGVAGLAAARALRLAGIDDFALLELEETAGGNSRGSAVHGFKCPLGAHYLPLPGDDATEVQDLLEELGLRQRIAGRWQYDERHLCHSPQERLFYRGEWQEGLLPMHGVSVATLREYRRFASAVQDLQMAARFTIPTSKAPLAPVLKALDAIVFESWLNEQGLVDADLRWFLDYCCRDDFGAGIAQVSAWAGIHYFASRHGFSVPGDDSSHDAQHDGVLTWPQGNGWLTDRLAAPLQGRLHTGRVVQRIDASGRSGVTVDAFNANTQSVERWHAAHCIVALPLFIAARVVQDPSAVLTAAAAQLHYAPWLVSNIHVDAALADRPGAPPSWDNVIHDSSALGYVDAMHQSLRSVPGSTVLTHYHALLATQPDPATARRTLLEKPWSHWRDFVLTDLDVPHPDLRAKATRIDVTRWAHAMSTPVPGVRCNAALTALQNPPAGTRLQFAHSDLSGYSIFEEAFAQGHRAGLAVAASSHT